MQAKSKLCRVAKVHLVLRVGSLQDKLTQTGTKVSVLITSDKHHKSEFQKGRQFNQNFNINITAQVYEFQQ
jgi:hypothetical protein